MEDFNSNQAQYHRDSGHRHHTDQSYDRSHDEDSYSGSDYSDDEGRHGDETVRYQVGQACMATVLLKFTIIVILKFSLH